MLGKTSRCGGCGKSVPKNDQFCGKCARAGGSRRSGNVSTLPAPKAQKIHVCGQRKPNGQTCHRSLVGSETCPNH